MNIFRGLKHVTIKETLSELRQKFWVCRSRGFAGKFLKDCTLCRKYEGQPFHYTVAPPFFKLLLYDKSSFYASGIDNSGNSILLNIWVTLYTFAASCAVILDLIPHLDSDSFIRSFRRFIARRGCPSNVMSDGGRNVVSNQTQTLVHILGVDWRVNLPLACWHNGFFERLVGITNV